MEAVVSNTRQQRNSGTSDPQNALSDHSAKSILIQTCQALFSKELTTEETDFWAKLLKPVPVAAVRYAFDNWNRNARFFPKPKDILELVEAFNLSKIGPRRKVYEHHGQGYGEKDVLYLWQRYSQKRAELNRTLTDNEVEVLMLDLDKKRGVVPDFRPMW